MGILGLVLSLRVRADNMAAAAVFLVIGQVRIIFTPANFGDLEPTLIRAACIDSPNLAL